MKEEIEKAYVRGYAAGKRKQATEDREAIRSVKLDIAAQVMAGLVASNSKWTNPDQMLTSRSIYLANIAVECAEALMSRVGLNP